MNGYRILVVEDDAVARRALERLLAHRGWVVSVARSVAEAMQQLSPLPHCILLDLMLPDGDGEQVLQKIREENLPVKVAICTGTNDRMRLERVAEMAPAGIFVKPIDFGQVCRMVEEDDTVC